MLISHPQRSDNGGKGMEEEDGARYVPLSLELFSNGPVLGAPVQSILADIMHDIGILNVHQGTLRSSNRSR